MARRDRPAPAPIIGITSLQISGREGPDILQELFGNYVAADLRTAGATAAEVERLLDRKAGDITGRFEPVRNAWEACRYTGYGEATRLIARIVYGIAEIDAGALLKAQEQSELLRDPGARYRLLHDMAGIDHVQIDDFQWACHPDPQHPEFYLHDLNWASFTNGTPDLQALEKETGIRVRSVESLDDAIAALFGKYGRLAIAVKTQHAYSRTLGWQPRERSEVEAALRRGFTHGLARLEEADRLCLGDWCLARAIDQAAIWNLPVKIHTGYHAGTGTSQLENSRPTLLSELLRSYPSCRFVLMHAGWPYGAELIALAKHYPNVWVDLCWAWAMNPLATRAFVRQFLHAVPVNKLFAFGGDTFWPSSTLAYATQARRELQQTFEEEIRDGYLNEQEAIRILDRICRANQYDCFDVTGRQQAAQDAVR